MRVRVRRRARVRADLVGDQQPEWVHRVRQVVLVHAHARARVAAHTVQVHVHVLRHGGAARLPADDRRDVGLGEGEGGGEGEG